MRSHTYYTTCACVARAMTTVSRFEGRTPCEVRRHHNQVECFRSELSFECGESGDTLGQALRALRRVTSPTRVLVTHSSRPLPLARRFVNARSHGDDG